MKKWESIEEICKELGISERTAWRWIGKGKIKKMKSEDGLTFFTLTTDVTDTDNVSSDSNRVSVVSKAKRDDHKLYKNYSSVIPVPDPSPELKARREEVEAVELEIRRLRGLKQLKELSNPYDPLADKRSEIERFKIEEELRSLKMRTIKEERIEKMKEEVLKGWKEFLPSHILVEIVCELNNFFHKSDIYSFNDMLIYGGMIRDVILRKYSKEVFESIKSYLFDHIKKSITTLIREMLNDIEHQTGRPALEVLRDYNPAIIQELLFLGIGWS